jgi:hypothetical protein
MAKGSAGIRVGISMEGVQEFAAQADRAAAKTEQLQQRSERAIGGVMSALQRQFDRLTKSQEQIGLEKLQRGWSLSRGGCQVSRTVVCHQQVDGSRKRPQNCKELRLRLQSVLGLSESSRLRLRLRSSPWIGDCKLSVL